MPIAFHYILASLVERLMTFPLISLAQVRILREGVVEALRAPDGVPDDLMPKTAFDERAIRAGLPDPGRFGRADLRCFPGGRKNPMPPSERARLNV